MTATTNYTTDEVLAALAAREEIEDAGYGGERIDWFDLAHPPIACDAEGNVIRSESGSLVYEENTVSLRGEDVPLSVVHETGGEEQGSYASIVIALGSQFFRKEGYYASHYGADWDGSFHEVEPRQVVVTEYKRVRG
ncbi:hypothetical protein [Brevibacterium album]|uniref:hypothetical protein n=1 Tax=Brevibacterium album TaxID=417948 RepID=UPI000422E18E|nr:hypothetical protein [Brevibacterium album]